VFVVNEIGDAGVVAYYASCKARVATEAATPPARKGTGRYPQPVALLARLSVDTRHEGQGLGAALLQDVFANWSSCPTGSAAAVCWSTPRLHGPGTSTCTSFLNLNPAPPTTSTSSFS
jgi:hypothetical protein